MALQLLALALAVVAPAGAYQVRKVGGRPAGAQLPLPRHPWPHARGPIPGQYGASGVAAPPRDLSAALAWSYHHPGGQYHSVVAGGPVIDRELNLYIVMSDGVRKLSSEGQELWHYVPPGGVINNEACLHGSAVLGSSETGHAFALDAATGKALWERQLAANAGADCGYPAAHDGVFVVGSEEGRDLRSVGGNRRVFGLDVGSGQTLWEFRPEAVVWNLTPLFPGDGTTVFMDFTGGVYRLGLHNGTLLWHARAPLSDLSFSDGGASLSPDGSVYTCSNYGNSTGAKGTQGVVRAFSLAVGQLLWERILQQPCNSYPAVGSLDGGSALSVVITPGPFFGNTDLHGSIEAFDAATGEPQWQFQAPPFTGTLLMARGDIRGLGERLLANPAHPLCAPAHWSAPTISSDGSVFVGRLDGLLYAVRGPAGGRRPPAAALAAANGTASSPGVEVAVFNADSASLHGASAWAPGMFAFASCDTLYVFKY